MVLNLSANPFATPEDRAKGVPEIERDTAHNLGCASDERWHIRKDGVRFFASGVQTAAEQYAATSDTALYQAWGIVAASMRRINCSILRTRSRAV